MLNLPNKASLKASLISFLSNNVLATNFVSPQRRFPQYKIGRGTYGKFNVYTWGEGATLIIGAFCSIASGVKIFLGGEHRTNLVTTYPFNILWNSARHLEGHPITKGDVIVGNDVWIGSEAMIMSGVRIGNGAVIGARSVVARDIPAFAIAVGNPARVVKMRFDDKTIDRLLRTNWWDWDDNKIERFLPLMFSNIESFLDAVEKELPAKL